MTTEKKVARRKLSLLELAQDLGNVSKACRIMGYSRQQFYEIRRNFQTYGAEGLIELGALPEGLEGAVPRATSEEFSSHLRYLGRRAVVAETAEARVELLGDIWATCADCHSRVR